MSLKILDKNAIQMKQMALQQLEHADAFVVVTEVNGSFGIVSAGGIPATLGLANIARVHLENGVNKMLGNGVTPPTNQAS